MFKKINLIFSPLQSRLSRKIILWIFASIIVIEAIILIPSVKKKEQELLLQLQEVIFVKIPFLMKASGETTPQDFLKYIKEINLDSNLGNIVGASLYNQDKKLIGTFGEKSDIVISQLKQKNNFIQKNNDKNRYDLVWFDSQIPDNCILIIRSDSGFIQQELWFYQGRIVVLVIIIAIFVTGVMMIVLSTTVIAPILQLRDNLLSAPETLKKYQNNLSDNSTYSKPRNDELGDLNQAFQQMTKKLVSLYNSLENQVEERTKQLSQINEELQQEIEERITIEEVLQETLSELKNTQVQMIQNEKMSSLGQMVAGVAHEINNPVNFIYGNIIHAQEYINDLLSLIKLYIKYNPEPHENIVKEIEAIDLDFLIDDIPKILESMKVGADRIQKIVLSLRTFSRLDEAEMKKVDIHEGIESTLLILQNRLKAKPNHPEIKVIKNYGNLPLIECYASQLNQVFMNILANSIDALEEKTKNLNFVQVQKKDKNINIETKLIKKNKEDWIKIKISDNGLGMNEETKKRLFEPFYT